MNDNLKIIATFIKEMYLKDINLEEIYEKLKNNNSFLDIYNEYKIKYNKDNYLKTLDKISKDILSKKIDSKKLDYDYNTKEFMRIWQKKDQYIYEKFAYPLYLFTRNLYFALVKDNVSSVYFFAREGEFLKKIFDLFQENIIGPKIKTNYLYVSRASTFLGTLDDLDKEKFTSLFSQYPTMSLETFLKNLAFTKEEITLLNKDLDFSKERENLKDTKEFKQLIKREEFKKIYDQKRKKAKENFLQYLATFGDDYKRQLYVVDVGWKGSIQNNIEKIIPGKVKGYYVGLVNYEKIINYKHKEAILFENTIENKSLNGYLYNSNRSLFEILLGASHGSTINYEVKKGKVRPVLNNLEKELIMYQEKIKPIQDNLLNKFKEINNILNYSYYDINKIDKAINKKYFSLIFSPSKEEIAMYNSFYHFENFGIMSYSTFALEKKVTLKNKLFNYRHFRSFIQYDHNWQYLKLDQYHMQLGKFLLYWYKWYYFKKNKVI